MGDLAASGQPLEQEATQGIAVGHDRGGDGPVVWRRLKLPACRSFHKVGFWVTEGASHLTSHPSQKAKVAVVTIKHQYQHWRLLN